MNFKLIVRDDAHADILDAHRWYRDRPEEVGRDFAKATDFCLDSIRRNPFAYPQLYKKTRRALRKNFPFGIFFRVRHDPIAIVGCFHVRRNPAGWKKRG